MKVSGGRASSGGVWTHPDIRAPKAKRYGARTLGARTNTEICDTNVSAERQWSLDRLTAARKPLRFAGSTRLAFPNADKPLTFW